MARTDDERMTRLRPPKPRHPTDERIAWSSGFKLLMYYARSSRKVRNRGASGGKMGSTRPYLQRCAVRVTYLNNRHGGNGRRTADTWHARAPHMKTRWRAWASAARTSKSTLRLGLKTGRDPATSDCGS